VLVVVALGITWLLDGLESNLAGSLARILKRKDTLGFSDAQLGRRALPSCGSESMLNGNLSKVLHAHSLARIN
jgi:hypothetical protein